ncbi:type I glutamate--ammonia ligase [Pseudenhygromyxa sp. WMMC2535]|uniref:type I glutamate--ammonia ligase n=1 Tax=Pseudenhygromyxa sp. WMMC2535 TaxID=2712867 RepID=UPI001555824A|nr:type I glutamate--ammonia ligase [Pseudenhygromyxa sp. WMMC2535]NVB42093.1 type I glutamate--ammonia ligase [Pseudenhygromyxa sp. WMMC2535]
MSEQTPKTVIDLIRDQEIRMVDLRFIDLLGAWQHFTVPAHELTEEAFEEGFGFDGSSVRGWKTINASDMLVIPDAASAKVDPFMEAPTLALLGNAVDTITRSDYERCPRSLAGRAQDFLRSTGIADTFYVGPEAEFFIFDDVRFETSTNRSFYAVDSDLGHWNTAREEFPNLGYKVRPKGGYVPVPPTDSLHDLRTEMVLALEEVGITVERQHMEVASGGQAEIDIRYDSLLSQADKMAWFKYVIKNVARRAGKTVTFMPKPLFGDNGNGMHTHMSLWKDGNPLFAGEQYAGLSELALHFIAGVLKHASALCAFTNPSTNSYKRLVPGFEAPVNLAYSSRNRSAAIRIPTYSSSPKAIRIEFRTPDPSCNPYLAFSALLMAGLDGIQKRMDPGEPLDKDIYSLTPEELSNVPSVPAHLAGALDALEEDHEFLLAGDVFSRDLLEAWVDWKRSAEVTQVRGRPHPHEFSLYFDC